jgi:L-threonylcarbamoyladenylate synthase
MKSVSTRTVNNQVDEGIAILKKGGIVAYPTDTVYGLGASMTSIAAVERIFEVKGRPKGIALPLLVADREQIKQIAKIIPPAAWLLI